MEETKKTVGVRKHKKVTFIIAWVLLLALIGGFVGLNVAKYEEYYALQDMAIATMSIALNTAGESYDDSSREATVDDFYSYLSPKYGGTIKVNGKTFDMSGIAEAQDEIIEATRKAFREIFDYPYYDVQYIFEYKDQVEFSLGQIFDPYYDDEICYMFYGICGYFLLLLISQFVHLGRCRRTIEIDGDTVICGKKPGKTVNIPISRITKVKRTGYKGVAIKSPGASFKITMMKNQVELVNAITDLMNAKPAPAFEEAVPVAVAAPVPAPAPAAEPDMVSQLTQLKELMDGGIITQEEFDAKKKQLLGL